MSLILSLCFHRTAPTSLSPTMDTVALWSRWPRCRAAVASLSPHDHDFGGQNGSSDFAASASHLSDFLFMG